MSNLLELAGVQKDKPTKFAPIYVGRFSSGIWTNRNPLRDANTTRIVEKFYGASGDALIAGSNVEITNKLTLARRPGNTTFDGNTWDSINSFYSFHAFQGYAGQAPTDHVNVIIDEPNTLSALVVGQGSQAVWDKSSGAGQTYSQSVGNSRSEERRVGKKCR